MVPSGRTRNPRKVSYFGVHVSLCVHEYVFVCVCVCVCVCIHRTKNEALPFAATWMDLEVSILCEVRQSKTNII